MTGLELVVAALAAARVTRLIVTDDLPPVTRLRSWWLTRWPAESTRFTDAYPAPIGPNDGGHVNEAGRPVIWIPDEARWAALHPHPLGELVDCPWCAGFWVSVAVVAFLAFVPGAVWWLAPWAVSWAVGQLNQSVAG